MKIFLIRHGQSEADLKNVIECNADFDLTEHGKKQAGDLVEKLTALSPFNALYSSPLKRARGTAMLISEKHGLPVIIDDRLAERNVGEMAGMNRNEAFKKFPLPEGGLRPHHKMGGGTGESMLNFKFRTFEFFSELDEKHSNDKIIVVTHGGVINNFLCELFKTNDNVDFVTGDAGFHCIEKTGGRIIVHFLNNCF